MTTTLIIIAGILILLIVVVFVMGNFRDKGKTFNFYEKISSKLDFILISRTNKIENIFKNFSKILNFNFKESIVWFLRFILDLLHIITRKISIRISKLRNRYHKKSVTNDIPQSPSEYLREVGKEMDK
jgi:hypothetical protein